MRIAMDLQACQTASGNRGIGRYSLGLAKALLSDGRASDEFLVGLDSTYPREAHAVAAALHGSTISANISRYLYPGPNLPIGHPEDSLRPAAEVLVRRHYARLAPDLLHINSLFEGFAEHAVALTGLSSVPGAISSATLYDFIPQIYSSAYLRQPDYAAWYANKLASLHRFDLLLCISEATRRDAIRLMGLPEGRLPVVHAGVEPHYQPRMLRPEARAALASRWGIRGRFVLYTGNGDFRKNLPGAVAGFAAVPEEIRRGVQLVFNQIEDEEVLRALASKAGLAQSDLVVTGLINDADLIELFHACELFFFPSLYEGFGLPVLEAMACGAACLVANNSSLPEIVLREDAMFDASKTDQIAHALVRGLSDAGLRRSLSEHGIARAKQFTWQRSASLTRQAWDEALARKKAAGRAMIFAGLPRRRLALVTPLPPQRTGIANYMNDLLLPLSRHFDIDIFTDAPVADTGALQQQFTLHPWSALRNSGSRYAQIVYQFGNSPFHSYMVDLLEAMPGVVVLHDFFLSSMYAYMDQHENRGGLFTTELQYAHGRAGVLLLEREGVEAVKKTFPMSRRIIERAVATIVHSSHSLELCKRYFPCINRKAWYQIPQLRHAAPAQTAEDRSAVRLRLDIARSDFLIVSFGFLADTKLNERLLDALAMPPLASDRAVKLVFVGENDGGDYGRAIATQIAAHPLRENILITGFASESEYLDYLRAADCAVQLRGQSKGETSRAVLDCMAHALATIVNDSDPFRELPNEVVRKISTTAPASELVTVLAQFKSDRDWCRALGQAARNHILEQHAPGLVAAQYAFAIAESIAAQRARGIQDLVSGLGDAFSREGNHAHEMDVVANVLRGERPVRQASRLYLDLSEVVKSDYGTGIHRVVRNLTAELLLSDVPTQSVCVPVAHDESGNLDSAEPYIREKLMLPMQSPSAVFAPEAGDSLFLLDSAWTAPERYAMSIDHIQLAGGQAGAMVYDLVPIQFPEYCVSYMPEIFERWLRFVVTRCDFVVCISAAVAEELERWITELRLQTRSGFRIRHIHLGSDLKEHTSEPPSQAISQVMARSQTVLMVGTIEPRKRHDTVLDAMEMAWQRGSNLRLVIIGKAGWNHEALIKRMRNHPSWQQYIFWLEGISDADLEYAYQHAAVFLQASAAEGFGLPIVEAARFGRPLVLSDLPVFRELAGGNATYFSVGDAAALCEILLQQDWLAGSAAAVKLKSWSESARDLRNAIENFVPDAALRKRTSDRVSLTQSIQNT